MSQALTEIAGAHRLGTGDASERAAVEWHTALRHALAEEIGDIRSALWRGGPVADDAIFSQRAASRATEAQQHVMASLTRLCDDAAPASSHAVSLDRVRERLEAGAPVDAIDMALARKVLKLSADFRVAAFEDLCLRRGRTSHGDDLGLELNRDMQTTIFLVRHANAEELRRIADILVAAPSKERDALRATIQNRYANYFRHTLLTVHHAVLAYLASVEPRDRSVALYISAAAASLHFDERRQLAQLAEYVELLGATREDR